MLCNITGFISDNRKMQDVFDYIESDCESNGTDTSDDGQMFSTNQTMMDAKVIITDMIFKFKL